MSAHLPERSTPASSPGGSPADAVVLGVDIGGTKTHAIAALARGGVLAEAVAGSSNVQNVSREQARAAIRDLFERLVLPPDPAPSRVVIGSGGVDTPEDAAALRDLFRPHLPEARIDVVHDTRLILAAGGARTGVGVIAGTGSVAWGINEAGAEARRGGWGYLLGDEGSGYWFGREAVRHTLAVYNMDQPVDELGSLLLESCGVDAPEQLIGRFHGDTDRAYWAGRAGLVFKAAAAGHAPSIALIDDGAAHLARIAAAVAGQLGLTGPVVVGGGLGMNQPALQERFAAHAGALGLTNVSFLHRDPVFGAVDLARGVLD